jgi:dTDP-4-dehydrorhamnose 3,5-epimerase
MTNPHLRFTPGEIDGVVVRRPNRHTDARGWLIECFRTDELPPEMAPPMAYISLTRPGVARGPHEHVDQSDNFLFFGPSTFKVYLWDARAGSATRGKSQTLLGGQDAPLGLIVPPGVIHAYKNVGEVDGLVFNAPNRLFAGRGRKEKVDEIRHEDIAGSPYVMD